MSRRNRIAHLNMRNLFIITYHDNCEAIYKTVSQYSSRECHVLLSLLSQALCYDHAAVCLFPLWSEVNVSFISSYHWTCARINQRMRPTLVLICPHTYKSHDSSLFANFLQFLPHCRIIISASTQCIKALGPTSPKSPKHICANQLAGSCVVFHWLFSHWLYQRGESRISSEQQICSRYNRGNMQ